MILFKEAAQLAKHIQQLKLKGLVIGFAPTMGALHAGHISLIAKSKSMCDVTVASIFVNPTQFNDPNDFKKYPVTIANDVSLLETAGCDVLFLPPVSEIYPDGTNRQHHYDVGGIEFLLEGKFRPGHFQGVCQVVHRLLDIVHPDNLFMGEKDYQQCLVIKRLVQLTGMAVNVIVTDTYREASGLAMSSRNLRLNEQQKQAASAISAMLKYIKDNYRSASFSDLEKHAADYLLASGFNKVDYVSIADAETLQPAGTSTDHHKIVALIAAFIGEIRLIDNVVLQD